MCIRDRAADHAVWLDHDERACHVSSSWGFAAAPERRGSGCLDERRSGSIVDRHRGHGAVDVGLAVRAHPPARFDGLAARGAGGAQPAAAGGAHEVVVAHRRLAERAARLLAQALLHHLHLELLLTTVGDELRRPDDGVDDAVSYTHLRAHETVLDL